MTYAIRVDDPLAVSPEAFANAYQGVFATKWESQIDNTVSFVRTTVLIGAPGDEILVGESTDAPSNGTGTGNLLPPQVAVLCKKLTGFGGRLNRGRMYIPYSLHDDDVDDDGTFAGSALSDRQDAADDWLDEINTAGQNVVIANRVYDLPWTDRRRRLVAVHTGHDVTGINVESTIATQRRRLLR